MLHLTSRFVILKMPRLKLTSKHYFTNNSTKNLGESTSPKLYNSTSEVADRVSDDFTLPKARCLPFLLELVPGNENCHLRKNMRSYTPV